MISSGRLEKENKLQVKIENRLSKLPRVLTDFYNDMRGDRKSFTTIDTYTNYIVSFMNYITQNNPTEDFYLNATTAIIKQYLVSLQTREIDGQTIRAGDDIQAT